ncbi:MAG: hypothetical protein E6K64_01595 [Nitrospirae bacterium]|nr:MAG: hypothetical protein E6K64_01595 [Nitrospirota bacterium]
MTNEAADFRRGLIAKPGEHGSGHPLLAVPADAVSLAETEPQSREELGGDHGFKSRTCSFLFLQIHQQKQEGAARAFGALPFDRQEVQKSLFVVSLPQPTLQGDAA